MAGGCGRQGGARTRCRRPFIVVCVCVHVCARARPYAGGRDVDGTRVCIHRARATAGGGLRRFIVLHDRAGGRAGWGMVSRVRGQPARDVGRGCWRAIDGTSSGRRNRVVTCVGCARLVPVFLRTAPGHVYTCMQRGDPHVLLPPYTPSCARTRVWPACVPALALVALACFWACALARLRVAPASLRTSGEAIHKYTHTHFTN